MTVTVRLDTPLLQGGPTCLLGGGGANGWTLATELRESQVKGLLHTFARALFLPLLDESPQKAKHAERLLLGAPSGTKWKKNGKDQEYGKVVSIETSVSAPSGEGTYCNRPGKPEKGSRRGVPPGATYTITLRLMPWVPEPETHLKALWAVLWTGLCFGAIGIRSRRGYVGLTPTHLNIQSSAAGQGNDPGLPLFSSPPTDGCALAKQLSDGFAKAQDLVKGWINRQSTNGLKLVSAFQVGEDPFQIKDLTQVFIGEPRNGGNAPWEAVMIPFMNKSSDERTKNPEEHSKIIGSGGKDRLASPVWLRIFKTNSGYVPVITLGSSKTFNGPATPKPIVQALLNSVNAKPISPTIPEAGAEGATP
jgi:hypothetical protein